MKPSKQKTKDDTREKFPKVDRDRIKVDIIEALKTCYDPEIPVNIYELGLIYDVEVDPLGNVHVEMTLTSPTCPVVDSLLEEVYEKIKYTEGVNDCHIELVWDPPWSPDRMTESARLDLGLM